jgi:hypothetical protein
MLVRLFAKNFGVFRDGFDLSLEATDLRSDCDRGYFEVDIKGEDKPLRLLRLIAIYGPNGSGKTTIIEAAQQLHMLAVISGPGFQQDAPMRGYDPFRFDAETQKAPCQLGCEVVVDGQVVAYSVTFNAERIVAESAIERRDNGDRIWFERDDLCKVTVTKSNLKGKLTIDLGDVTRPNATVLSVAAQLEQTPLIPLFRAVRDSLRTLMSDATASMAYRYSVMKMHEEPAFREWALERLLKPADIGITNVSTKEREMPEDFFADRPPGKADLFKRRSMRFTPEATFSHRGVSGEYPIELEEESTGTQKMVMLSGPWYDVVHNGQTLFVDELSASLHPTLLIALLHALNTGPGARPSQLVFTVHDPSPLEDVLRRDEVYFTEKNDAGVASLFGLSEFSERQSTNINIRKRYLEGRYGGLPRLPDFGSIFTPAPEPES